MLNATTLIFTDGGCYPNPGPGAWAAIVRAPGCRGVELSGFDPQTTNNRMEMIGALAALEHLSSKSRVLITSDSQYLIKGATQWVPAWKRRGWRTKNGSAVLNRDLWEYLDALSHEHLVKWQWVRGHSGHPENERCDQLATERMALGRSELRGTTRRLAAQSR